MITIWCQMKLRSWHQRISIGICCEFGFSCISVKHSQNQLWRLLPCRTSICHAFPWVCLQTRTQFQRFHWQCFSTWAGHITVINYWLHTLHNSMTLVLIHLERFDITDYGPDLLHFRSLIYLFNGNLQLDRYESVVSISCRNSIFGH